MKRIPVISMILLLPLLTSCLAHGVRTGGLAPSYRSGEGTAYDVLGEVRGSSSEFLFMWCVPVTPPATLDAAAAEAMASSGADNIIDVRWWRENRYYVLGTVTILHVKGKAIRYHMALPAD